MKNKNKKNTQGVSTKIRESDGDLADLAEKEIETDINEEIYQARIGGKPPKLDPRLK